jgi:hypothetical protein
MVLKQQHTWLVLREQEEQLARAIEGIGRMMVDEVRAVGRIEIH